MTGLLAQPVRARSAAAVMAVPSVRVRGVVTVDSRKVCGCAQLLQVS